MAIPKFKEFLYPFLYQLKDKDVTMEEMTQLMIEHFKLSKEDCLLTTKGGSKTQIKDRMSWARQWLRRALFIDIPQKGTLRITERGREYLKTHTDLCYQDLLQYPEFVDFTKHSASSEKQPASVTEQSISFEEETTPTEQLESAYDTINKDLAADLLQKILDQSPEFFEHLVVDLLVKMGYGGSSTNAGTVTQYSHDDGIDGIISEDKLGLDKIYIQAKRYAKDNVVGKPQIQQFSGALDEKKANKGVFITTSSYSKEARAYVEKTSHKIVLIDGEELARYMIEYNVGVSVKQVYEVKRIDSDYFEE